MGVVVVVVVGGVGGGVGGGGGGGLVAVVVVDEVVGWGEFVVSIAIVVVIVVEAVVIVVVVVVVVEMIAIHPVVAPAAVTSVQAFATPTQLPSLLPLLDTSPPTPKKQHNHPFYALLFDKNNRHFLLFQL